MISVENNFPSFVNLPEFLLPFGRRLLYDSVNGSMRTVAADLFLCENYFTYIIWVLMQIKKKKFFFNRFLIENFNKRKKAVLALNGKEKQIKYLPVNDLI